MSSGGTPQQDIGAPPPGLSTGTGSPGVTSTQTNYGPAANLKTWWYQGKPYPTQAAANAAYQAANPVASDVDPTKWGTGGPTIMNTGAGVSSPGGTATLTATPTEQEIAGQINQEYQTEIQSTEAQQAQALGGLQAKEVAAEGSIKASTAARGLKLGTGSALMELVTQQERGGQAVQYQRSQGNAAISGMQQEQLVSLGKSALSATEQQQQNSQNMSNAWLQAFTFAATTAIDILQPELIPFTAAAGAGLSAEQNQNSYSDLQNLASFG